jgi:hypothetical protein
MSMNERQSKQLNKIENSIERLTGKRPHTDVTCTDSGYCLVTIIFDIPKEPQTNANQPCEKGKE